jgi:hypothetical protein
VKINGIEDDEKDRHHKYPLREKSKSPEKGNASQITYKQRRITDRREASANIADDKDEENRDVSSKPPFPVGPQNRSYQKHRSARCPKNVGDDPTNGQENGIISWGRLNIPAYEYSSGDKKERSEQNNERKIFLYFVDQWTQMMIMAEKNNYGQRENCRDDRFIPVALPEAAMYKREDGNAK